MSEHRYIDDCEAQRGCFVFNDRHLARLPENVRTELGRMCNPIAVSAGQTVASEGEELGYVGYVHRGVVRMQKTLSDGRQHIVGLLVEGDLFGRVFDGALHFTLEAATDAEICAFQRGPFEALVMESPELERLVMLNILDELDRARDWMVILANPRVRGRLAGFLMVVCTKFAGVDHLVRSNKNSVDVKVPITRADLAHLLGTRTESISRGFKALADSGCIAITKANRIRILDVEALAAEAGDDHAMDAASLRELVQVLQERRPD